MIGEARGNGRGTAQPATALWSDEEFNSQAVMVCTEVIDGAHQIHASGEGLRQPGQHPSPSGEGGQALTKSGIQTLNVGRVDLSAALGLLETLLNEFRRTLHDATLNREYPLRALLDYLNNRHVVPRT